MGTTLARKIVANDARFFELNLKDIYPNLEAPAAEVGKRFLVGSSALD